MSGVVSGTEVGALWLATLERAVARASHDVNDALNGVAVNVEVIRSRSSRPDLPAASLAQFGEAASQQLEKLTILTGAVLGTARPEREPVDIAVMLRRAAVLCGASSSVSDAGVTVVAASAGQPAMSSVTGPLARLALLAPLLDFVTAADRTVRASDVTCTLHGDDDSVFVTMSASDRTANIPAHLTDVLLAGGVRWKKDTHGLTLTFPRS